MARLKLGDKEKIVEDYQKRLKDSEMIAFVEYKGTNVADMTTLRNRLRESGARLNVIKFTLLKKALSAAKIKTDVDELSGKQLAVVMTGDDIVSPAKTIFDFGKTNENIKIIGSVIEGEDAGETGIAKLAALPSREQLIANAVGSIAAPIRGIVGVLQANLRNMVYVLKQIEASK